jgi:hypothetical protein
MKVSLAVIGVVAIVWLGLWLSNTGVLVYSAETRIPKTRECQYLVGITVTKRLEVLADRCPLMRSVSP